jgi:hypothetical protein
MGVAGSKGSKPSGSVRFGSVIVKRSGDGGSRQYASAPRRHVR